MDYGVETIKQQTTAIWLQVKVCRSGLSLQPINCTPALSVTQQRRCSCRLWRYISVIPLPLPVLTVSISAMVSKIHIMKKQYVAVVACKIKR